MKTYHETISKSLRPAYFERIKQIEQRAETEQRQRDTGNFQTHKHRRFKVR